MAELLTEADLGDMTDVQALEQINRIRALHEGWATRLGLAGWSLDHHYFRGGWADSRKKTQWSKAAAETWADFKYRHATMHWDLAQASHMSDTRLERLILHELVHCLTDHFKQYAMGDVGRDEAMPAVEMESQTTDVEMAIWWTWQEGLAAGRLVDETIPEDELT